MLIMNENIFIDRLPYIILAVYFKNVFLKKDDFRKNYVLINEHIIHVMNIMIRKSLKW